MFWVVFNVFVHIFLSIALIVAGFLDHTHLSIAILVTAVVHGIWFFFFFEA